MKRILAILLALMMLSVSAVSLGEAAPEQVSYSSFMEHLNAFLSSLDLQAKDVYMVESAQGQSYQMLIGQNESGTINLMVGENDEEIATLQIDNEAAYLKYQGSTMAIKFETIKDFFENLPNKLLSYLKTLGIDPEKIPEDFQTLMGLYAKMMQKIMPALEQEVNGDVVTIKLNGEKYGPLYAEAIEELMADASFQDIMGRYLPVFGAQYDAEQFNSIWGSIRDQMIELMKSWQMQMTVNQATGEVTMNGDFSMPEEAKMLFNVSVNTSDNGLKLDANVAVNTGDDEIKYEMAMNLEKNSFWLDFPNKGAEHVVMSQNGQEIMTMDASFELNDFGMPVSGQAVMTQQGQEIMRMQYADNTYVVYAQGQEMLFVQYKDEEATVRVGGLEMTAKKTEEDADHMVYEVNMTSNGQTMTMYATCTIAQDDTGAEFLQMDAKSGEEVVMIAQVLQTEKQAFPLLKDDAATNWITEDQLNGLLDTLFQTALSTVQGQLGN